MSWLFSRVPSWESSPQITAGCAGETAWGRILFPCLLPHLHFFTFKISVVSDSLRPHGLYSPWNSPDQNTEVGSLSLLQGIFPTQLLATPAPDQQAALQEAPGQNSPGPPSAYSSPPLRTLTRLWAPFLDSGDHGFSSQKNL